MDEQRKQEEKPSASADGTQAMSAPATTPAGSTFTTNVSGEQVGTIANIAHADTVIIQQSASSFAATSLHQLPSPLADFTGRQAEIDELLGLPLAEQTGINMPSSADPIATHASRLLAAMKVKRE
ncbi:MAG: hypothetical protein AB1489_24295 [Acidobacteriota bacterium]